VKETAQNRARVLMLCAHEPTKDPRIRWEAEFGSESFDVDVLGFNDLGGGLLAEERVGNYVMHRLAQTPYPFYAYFWCFQRLISLRMRVILGILLSPLLPVVIAAEILYRMAYFIVRPLVGLARTASLKLWSTRQIVQLLRMARRGLREWPAYRKRIGRVHYVVALLRVQFAPAAVLFWNYICNLQQKPNVVHCNDLDTLLVGVLAKKHFGCRVVYDAHEFYPFSDPEGSWVDTTFFRLLEQFLIKRADAVVTVNHLLAEEFRKTYSLARVHSVPNAEPWLDGHRRPLCTRMTDLANGRVKFLFQGRYSPGRGVEELIRAWSGVDGKAAALFLRGPANIWSDNYIALAADLGLLNRSVYFLDAVTEDELVSAAAEADVGIITYKPDVGGYKFACPNKLSQYLHAGLLVLTNDLPYVREVLDNSKAGLSYNSTDPATLQKVVDRLVTDPEFLRRGRMNALNFARGEFNWQHYSHTLHDLYSSATK